MSQSRLGILSCRVVVLALVAMSIGVLVMDGSQLVEASSSPSAPKEQKVYCFPNVTANTTCPPRVAPPLTWEGILVMCTVVIMIFSMAMGWVGSTPALFFTSFLYYWTGIIDEKEIFAGLVNRGMLTIAVLFPVVHPLSHLPLMQRLTSKLIDIAPGSSPSWALLKLCMFGWVVSPFLENVPHVALLTPIVAKKCREMKIPPAQMLMSMTMTIVSSNWMLLASASNLIMAGLQEDSGEKPLGFFELAKTNGWVSLLLIPYMIFAPKFAFRSIGLAAKGGGGGGKVGFVQRAHEFTTVMMIPEGSPHAGKSIKALLSDLPPKVANAIAIKEIHRALESPSSGLVRRSASNVPVSGTTTIHVGGDEDRLATSSNSRRASGLQQRRRTEGSGAFPEAGGGDDDEMHSVGAASTSSRGGLGQVTMFPEALPVTTIYEPGDDVVLRELDELVCAGTVSEMRAFRNLLDFHWIGIADDGQSSTLNRGTIVVPEPGTSEPVGSPMVEIDNGEEEELQLRRSGNPSTNNAPESPPSSTPTEQQQQQQHRDPEDDALPDAEGRPFIAKFVPAKHSGTVAVVPQVSTSNATFVTVVLSQQCTAVGSLIVEGRFTNKYRATIIAVREVNGHDVYGSGVALHRFEAGDTLLLRTDPQFAENWGKSPDFYMVEVLGNALEETIQRHYLAVPDCVPLSWSLGTTVRARGGKRYLQLPLWYPNISLLIFFGVIAAAMADIHAHVSAGVGIIILVFLGLMSVKEAISYVDWNVYIAGSFAFGTGYAMSNSGLAEWIGDLLVQSGVGGMLLLMLLHIVTGLLANVISNRGAIQVMYPIVVVLFRSQGLDLTPAAVIIANASMAGFLTPYGLSPSLVIAGPGGYESKHFLIFGTPLFILYAVLSAFATSLVYGFW